MLYRLIKHRENEFYLMEGEDVINQSIIEIYENKKYVGYVIKAYKHHLDILVQYLICGKSYEEIGIYAY